MSKSQILVVEDEPSIIEILKHNLERQGYEVTTAADGQSALAAARRRTPDLVILDLMIPVIDGLEVCRQLRSDSRTKSVRIIMLTARGEETDEVVGFNMGADDYVTKPFRVKPLLERVKAQLRRTSVDDDSGNLLSLDGIEIDRVNHLVRIDDRDATLTATEFRLLWTFMRQPGRAYTRHELMDSSRGEDANSLERTIDVHIRALRKKLGEKGPLIETVRGVGYRFKRSGGIDAD
jgi:two-component system, OmpR family, phosphate regulon response regulator PhoB